MNAGQVLASELIGAHSADWHVAGAADFTGDGKADILLHNDDGRIQLLTMNGAQVLASELVGTNAPSWHIVGTGDFTGDQKADILLHNDSGAIHLLTMNGAQVRGRNRTSAPRPHGTCRSRTMIGFEAVG